MKIKEVPILGFNEERLLLGRLDNAPSLSLRLDMKEDLVYICFRDYISSSLAMISFWKALSRSKTVSRYLFLISDCLRIG